MGTEKPQSGLLVSEAENSQTSTEASNGFLSTSLKKLQERRLVPVFNRHYWQMQAAAALVFLVGYSHAAVASIQQGSATPPTYFVGAAVASGFFAATSVLLASREERKERLARLMGGDDTASAISPPLSANRLKDQQ